MKKIKILVFLPYFLPGYKAGGPIRTIANMVDQLGDELDFHIVTSDRDLGDQTPFSNMIIDGWNTVGKAQVFYSSPGKRSNNNFARLISETTHDLLYLNGFFSPVFTQYPLRSRYYGFIPKRPTILAPRGEFSEGALNLKWFKKQIYLTFVKFIRLYHDITWHASSEHEENDIRRIFGFAAKRIIVAPNLPIQIDSTILDFKLKTRETIDPLKICFLSRISPMKNLDYALRLLKNVKVPIEFNIFGVIENKSYWQQCQDIIKNMPSHVYVNYHGSIEPVNVRKTLSGQDLFLLPTRGENYGHVIFESMSSGLPVLISDQTPWRNLASLGVGWDLPLSNPDEFCSVIEGQAKLDNKLLHKQRENVIQYAKKVSLDGNVKFANLLLFKSLIK